MKAIILGVGDEVLSGKVVNTNASYLSMELESIGIETLKTIVVGDNENHIKKEVSEFLNSDVEVLITTGGLGPTHDDFTKEVVCERLGLELVLNKEAKESLDNYYKGDYPKCNLKQAYFPESAIIIPNKIGTACGCILEVNHKIIIILVGPPHELMPMVNDTVKPYLKSKLKNQLLIKQYYLMGTSESKVEDTLKEYYLKYPNVNVAPYASLDKIRFQLTSLDIYEDEFNKACFEFEEMLDEFITSDKLEPIEIKVVNELKRLGYHISTAESCTGGMISQTIVNVSGSSSVFNESLVTYSNESKNKYLGVSFETINKVGVVSEEVVTEMVNGLSKLTGSEVTIAVSGIAGPTGGTDKKPVGLVHYAVKIDDKVYTFYNIFRGGREAVRKRATAWSLYHTYRLLKDYKR